MTFGVTQARGVTAIPGGGAGGLGSIYGSFSDSTTQNGSTTAGTPFTFNTDDFAGAGGVTLSNNSRLTVSTTGVYNIQFSAQISNSDTAPQDVYIWIRVNGSDAANTNSLFGITAKKTPSDPSHLIAMANVFLSLTAGQYVEVVWLKTNANVTLTAFAASASPAYPATPSIIVTINQVG